MAERKRRQGAMRLAMRLCRYMALPMRPRLFGLCALRGKRPQSQDLPTDERCAAVRSDRLLQDTTAERADERTLFVTDYAKKTPHKW